MQLVESARDLGQYGPFKLPAEHGLDEVSSPLFCMPTLAFAGGLSVVHWSHSLRSAVPYFSSSTRSHLLVGQLRLGGGLVERSSIGEVQ